jgi:hypothetical protein
MTLGDVTVGFIALFTCIVLYAAYKSEPLMPEELDARILRRCFGNRNDSFPIWLQSITTNATPAPPGASVNPHEAAAHCADATVNSHSCGGHVGGH